MTKDQLPDSNQANYAINDEVVPRYMRFANVDQSIITITQDKVEIILRDHLKEVESKKSWMTPLGIFVSLGVIPITTDNFKAAFFLPAECWETIVYLALLVSLVWLILNVYKSWKNREASIKNIIKKMKNAESNMG